jgi:hypothetical protein
MAGWPRAAGPLEAEIISSQKRVKFWQDRVSLEDDLHVINHDVVLRGKQQPGGLNKPLAKPPVPRMD